MKERFLKHEFYFALAGIAACGAVRGALGAFFGPESLRTFLGTLLFSLALGGFVLRAGLGGRYGLTRFPAPSRRFLFYLPLLAMVSVSLWTGPASAPDPLRRAAAACSLFLAAFQEELLFRGMLFRALRKEAPKRAVLLSSLAFGAAHLANLFSGAGFPDVLRQAVCAAAAGAAFALLFSRCGSLLPCVLAHGLMNAFSVLARDPSGPPYAQAAALILAAGGYALYLSRLPESME